MRAGPAGGAGDGVRLTVLALLVGCAAPEAVVGISPGSPTTADDLVATLDGEATLVWLRDGEPVATGTVLPSAYTRKGESWRVEARDGDRVLATDTVVVQNTAPEVRLEAARTAPEGEDVRPVLEVVDPDGDALSWTARWAADDREPLTTLGLPGSLTRVGEVWTLLVTATDGEAEVRGVLTVTIDPRPDPGIHLFDDTVMHAVRLDLTPEATQQLRDAPTEWVRGDLVIDGEAYADVGVRLKGHGSFRPIDEKPSFRIELDRWVAGQEHDGLDELVLNNLAGDNSRLRERLAYGAYRDFEVPAPRAAHATVALGETAYGLYSLVESVDGRFLDRWFTSGDGPLYEIYDADFVAGQVETFDHDGGPDDRAVLHAVAAALAEPDVRLTTDLAHLVDIDALITYLAVSAVIGQFDAYPWSFPGDDLYVYVDPTDGRVRFAAHGGDETFTDRFRPVDYLYGRLGEACLDDPTCRTAWIEQIWRVCDHLPTIAARIDGIAAQIADAVVTDTRLGPGTAHRGQAEVADFIAGRRAALEAMPGLR